MLLNKINEEGKTKNMKLNAKKTKVMYIGKKPYKDISIDGETLERVENFTYLGSSKAQNGDCKPDIVRRIAQGKTKMIALKNIWKDKDLSTNLKIKIMKTLVWTTMTYGAEGWTLKTEEKRRVQAAEIWCYRRLLNITWKDKKPNSEILKELEKERELYGIIVKRKLTYFGHMSRNTNSSITKIIVQGKVEGKRGRGRPKISYMDNVRLWTGMSTQSVFKATLDRESWRNKCWESSRAANALLDDAA